MLSIEEIKKALHDRRIRMVAKACGLSYQAIYNILNNAAQPTNKTIEKLSNYLEQ